MFRNKIKVSRPFVEFDVRELEILGVGPMNRARITRRSRDHHAEREESAQIRESGRQRSRISIVQKFTDCLAKRCEHS